MEVVNALGRRKSAIARIFVSEGTGKITINKRDLAEYFPSSILQYVVKQPLNKLGVAEKYDIKVNLCGGGFTGIELATELPARLRTRFGHGARSRRTAAALALFSKSGSWRMHSERCNGNDVTPFSCSPREKSPFGQ